MLCMLKIHSIDGNHRNYQEQQLNSNLPAQAARRVRLWPQHFTTARGRPDHVRLGLAVGGCLALASFHSSPAVSSATATGSSLPGRPGRCPATEVIAVRPVHRALLSFTWTPALRAA
jgi:hypothetical protein